MLTIDQTDHDDLCHGWSWTVSDEVVLAEQVARVAIGQYRHVASILSGAGLPGPSGSSAVAAAAIEHLTVPPGTDPWHRDGWLFQTISWIAAHHQPGKAGLIRAPQIRSADKGFDGVQLEISADGTSISAVVIFEDKATERARETIREDVWPEISEMEAGKRIDELSHEVSALLDRITHSLPQADIDEAISNILWKEARRYRVSITVDDVHRSALGRKRLFSGFDSKVSGDVIRRRAETLYLPHLRIWMEGFARQVIEHLKAIGNV